MSKETYRYHTIAADQSHQGHSDGWLGKGDHRHILEKQADEGFIYIGWVPVTFGDKGRIKEIDLIFKRVANTY